LPVTLDHVLVCCSVGAEPEAAALAALGLREGSANTHPGQGTACRRFFFQNAYLELFWVSDPAEAQSEAVLPTQLWDRWSKRATGACPFALVFRPSKGDESPPPFETWPYRPSYVPPGMSIDVARNVPLSDPALFYLSFQRDASRGGQEPRAHPLPLTQLTSVAVQGPTTGLSAAMRATQAAGLVSFEEATEHAITLRFDAGDRGSADLRPTLPLWLAW
jgi:hypothetical protein